MVKRAPLQQYNMCLSKYKYLSNCIPTSLCVSHVSITVLSIYNTLPYQVELARHKKKLIDWYIYTV